MNTKRVILGVLCAAGAIGVSVWLALGYQTRLRLEEENQGLRQQVDQMAELVAENERLSNLVAQASQSRPRSDDQMRELLRPRAEVGALRQQGKVLESLHVENRQAPASPESANPAVEVGALRQQGKALESPRAENPQAPASPESADPAADNWPKESWAFAGYASPSAAVQSCLWAASKGDVKTFLRGVTGDAQMFAEKLLAGRSESEISAAVTAQFAGIKSLRVVSREVQDENTVVLTTASEEESGTVTKKALMKKVGNEWKLAGEVQ